MSRQSTPLDVQDQDSLVRIAKLAAQVMSSLRTLGRGQYSSERGAAFLGKRGRLLEHDGGYRAGVDAPCGNKTHRAT